METDWLERPSVRCLWTSATLLDIWKTGSASVCNWRGIREYKAIHFCLQAVFGCNARTSTYRGTTYDQRARTTVACLLILVAASSLSPFSLSSSLTWWYSAAAARLSLCSACPLATPVHWKTRVPQIKQKYIRRSLNPSNFTLPYQMTQFCLNPDWLKDHNSSGVHIQNRLNRGFRVHVHVHCTCIMTSYQWI